MAIRNPDGTWLNVLGRCVYCGAIVGTRKLTCDEHRGLTRSDPTYGVTESMRLLRRPLPESQRVTASRGG